MRALPAARQPEPRPDLKASDDIIERQRHMADKVAVTATMLIHPDKIDAALNLVRRFQEETARYPGLIVVRALHDAREPTRLMFYTEFENRDAAESYVGWRRARGDFEQLSGMLVAPAQTQSWSTVIEPA